MIIVVVVVVVIVVIVIVVVVVVFATLFALRLRDAEGCTSHVTLICTPVPSLRFLPFTRIIPFF